MLKIWRPRALILTPNARAPHLSGISQGPSRAAAVHLPGVLALGCRHFMTYLDVGLVCRTAVRAVGPFTGVLADPPIWTGTTRDECVAYA